MHAVRHQGFPEGLAKTRDFALASPKSSMRATKVSAVTPAYPDEMTGTMHKVAH